MPERREILDSPANERVREMRGFSRRSARLQSGATVAEGPLVVAEALQYVPDAITDIFVSEDGAASRPDLLVAVRAVAETHPGLWLHHVSKRVSNSFGSACQGWSARVRLAGLPALSREVPGSLCLVLPATQDPGNMGTMIRLADACGASAVFVGADSADPVGPKAMRASTGSVFHLPTPRFDNLELVLATLQKDGWTVAGTSARAAVTLHPGNLAPWKQKTAWMMGNEAHGLTPQQESLCDVLVSIPMYGKAESLNVTSAASLALWLTATAQDSK